MSHLHERKEKICLNCNAQLTGRYCQDCGQENVEPKESIGHLFVHFFNDITHFDGKFFRTIRLLLTKPGYLALMYKDGRRASYINPIRLYLFTSFLFFFVFYSLIHVPDYTEVLSSSKAQEYLQEEIESNNRLKGSYDFQILAPGDVDATFIIVDVPAQYRSGVHAYDSIQQTLPKGEKDGIITKWFCRRYIASYEFFLKSPATVVQRSAEAFLQSFSKVFFISLPLFAMFLYLLYIGKRKEYYFVSQVVFSIHFYCVLFLLILLSLLFLELASATDHVIMVYLFLACYFAPLPYLWVAMQRFYKQFWLATFFKGVLQYLFTILLFFALTMLLMFNSILSVHSGN